MERGEQNSNAVAIAHFLYDDGLKTSERAIGNLDDVTGFQCGADDEDIDGFTRPLLELVDDDIVDGGWAPAEADDIDDVGRVADGAEIVGEVKPAEEIARKERAGHPTLDASDGFDAFEFRVVGMESEHIPAVLFGSRFLAGSGVNAEPAGEIGE